jgi:hypothetical protein
MYWNFVAIDSVIKNLLPGVCIGAAMLPDLSLERADPSGTGWLGPAATVS